jgi:hypothetical protein
MKKFFFASLLLTATAFFYSFVAPGVTQIKIDEPISFTRTFINPCTNENVELTYVGTYSARGVLNNNRLNITEHINIKIDGVGVTSGATYTGHVSQHFTSNGTGVTGGQAVTHNAANANLNTSGGGNNVKESFSVHATMNANGELVNLKFDNFTQTCQ